MKVQVQFMLERETKGALRYAELSSIGNAVLQPNNIEAIIGTLYIRKLGLSIQTKRQTKMQMQAQAQAQAQMQAQDWPSKITITIEH